MEKQVVAQLTVSFESAAYDENGVEAYRQISLVI
jgi:hypothetical protein